jgi:3'(2'), 5'-bisphosphate nucleotidase
MNATDGALAADLAERAGQVLLRLREDATPELSLRDEGDRRSNEFLLDRLAEHRPEDAVLSEESADSPARLDADRVWIIDPLDGTREFAEAGRTDWAVHVALIEHGRAVGAGGAGGPRGGGCGAFITAAASVTSPGSQ